MANADPSFPRLSPARTLGGLSAAWSAYRAMVWKELTVMARYPVEFVASFGQVFAIVAIFTLAGLSFSTTAAGTSGAERGSISGVVTYGFMLFMFISDTLWTIGYNVRNEQVQGTLEQLYLSPANKFSALLSRVSTILVWTGLLSLAGMWLMTSLLGSLPVENPLLALYLLIFALLGMFGLGFAFAALTLRVKEAAQTAANLLQFSLLILCAHFFPFSALPEPVLAVSRLLPMAYTVDAFRSTLMGYPPGFPELASIEVEIAIVTIFGIVMPVVGYYLYRGAENYARRKGSLAEF
jgi:ABC-2 type transport system permease protein